MNDLAGINFGVKAMNQKVEFHVKRPQSRYELLDDTGLFGTANGL